MQPFQFTKIGGLTQLQHFLIVLKCHKWAKTSYQTMSCWEYWKITLMSYAAIIWLWMIHYDLFDTSLDGFFRLFQLLLMFMVKFGISCHVDNFDSTKLAIFGLIKHGSVISTGFTTEPFQKHPLDICHLRDLGATYPKHFFLLIPMCKWSPNDLRICMNLKHIISYTFFIGIFSLACVGGCKSTWKVHSCDTVPQIAKLPQNS